MKGSTVVIAAAVGLLCVVLAASIHSLSDRPDPLTEMAGKVPVTNQGKPWRIGYYEAGYYKDYPRYLIAFVEGLETLGWIEPIELPEPVQVHDDRELWDLLCSKVRSDYVEFVPEAFWSGQWKEPVRQAARTRAVAYLREGNVDFMIAMGTAAGLDLRDGHEVPTTVMSSTDPIAAGVIDSPADSGRDHLHAACDPERHYRQIRAFHNIVRFRRLGVIRDDTAQGRVYAHLDDLETAAREMGFALVVAEIPEEGLTDAQCVMEVARTIEQLAPQIDAFWVTDLRGSSARYMPEILDPLLVHKVPSWAPSDPEQVARGVMLGMPEQDIGQIGLFHARAMSAVFHGARPRDLPQTVEPRRAILVNQAVAERIDFALPPALTSPEVADRIFTEIAGEQQEPPQQ